MSGRVVMELDESMLGAERMKSAMSRHPRVTVVLALLLVVGFLAIDLGRVVDARRVLGDGPWKEGLVLGGLAALATVVVVGAGVWAVAHESSRWVWGLLIMVYLAAFVSFAWMHPRWHWQRNRIETVVEVAALVGPDLTVVLVLGVVTCRVVATELRRDPTDDDTNLVIAAADPEWGRTMVRNPAGGEPVESPATGRRPGLARWGRLCRVQTFLPFENFERSARALDPQRLGKQRVETIQVVRALTRPGYGWANHPAVLMWKGFEEALGRYGFTCCEVWTELGYGDTCAVTIATDLREVGIDTVRTQAELAAATALPPWLGDESVHRSHQSSLLRKDPTRYRPMFPGVPDDLPYVWPVRSLAVIEAEQRKAENDVRRRRRALERAQLEAERLRRKRSRAAKKAWRTRRQNEKPPHA